MSDLLVALYMFCLDEKDYEDILIFYDFYFQELVRAVGNSIILEFGVFVHNK